ncbi:MAG: HupE/UreJ family protein [Hyphomicrobiales bacterium]
MTLKRIGLATLALAWMTGLAEAHTGIGAVHGASAGFLHPLSGLDHTLAMVGVGLLAARIGGRALWALPAAFLGLMAVGGALGVFGVVLPFVETMIALSLIALAAALVLGARLGTVAGAALVGAFALFHGHAHGTEMPVDASGIAYALGFLAATAGLHGAGLALGLGGASAQRPALARAAAAVMAVAGVALLAGVA